MQNHRESADSCDKSDTESLCRIVAEIGPNHNGDVDKAKRLICDAALSGCDVIKLQYRRAEVELFDKQTKSYYFDMPRFKFIQEFQEFPIEVHRELRDLAAELGLLYAISLMSADLVSEVVDLEPDFIKIPSGEVTNVWLVEEVAATQLPVIASTGMSTIQEIDAMVNTIYSQTTNLWLLHCTSEYPTMLKDLNLRMIPFLANRYGCIVGLSDHSRQIDYIAGSVALGARMIEVHFTHDRQEVGPDHHISLEKVELKKLVESVRNWENVLGSDEKKLGEHVTDMRNTFTNSIVSRHNIEAGEIFSKMNLCLKKPATGLPPERLTEILGFKANKAIKANMAISPDDIETES